MRRTLAILITAAATIIAMTSHATQTAADLIDDTFLAALAAVESGGDDNAVNRAENAVGRYQIRACYLVDANRILGTHYEHIEMRDPEIAEAVVRAYLTHYGDALARRTGRPVTRADLARIHNGGPKGAEKDCTLAYAERVQAVWTPLYLASAAAKREGGKA